MDRSAGVYLGHRRLAIIDLSQGGHQPMLRDGLAISFNGEVYNYRHLRDRLSAAGERFQTKSDTEVLLAAWRRQGVQALETVDGMLALALWDGSDGWLAVDRFGEKSLYYATTPAGVYVSSELPVLVRLLAPSVDMSPSGLLAFYALGYVPAPATIYANIRRLRPGHSVRIARGEAQIPVRYWTPPFGIPGRGRPRPLSERELDKVQEALVESTRMRLEADVEPCVFLSSGVDSALIAGMMTRDLGRQAQCITVSFPVGAASDETAAARSIAGRLGLKHEAVESRDDPQAIGVDYMFGLFGQPHDNLTVASVHQMAAAAAGRGFRLALTGMGGDEAFLGYLKYGLFYKRRHYFNLPYGLRRAAGALASPLAPAIPAARAFSSLCAVPDAERYLAVKNLPAYDALRAVPGMAEWARDSFGAWPGPIEYDVPHHDVLETMPNSQLTTLDLGSMRASLELRTPFLSHRVQELVATFDPRSLLAFGQKSVLRRLLHRYLPPDAIESRKRGFSFPSDRFLSQFTRVPAAPGVPQATAERIWKRRLEARGWRNLATRMAISAAFPAWHSNATRNSIPPGDGRYPIRRTTS